MSDEYSYLYIDSVESNGEISVWLRDQAGVTIETYQASDFYFCFIPNNSEESATYWDMWNTPMKKCSFASRRDMKEFVDGERYVCESDVPPKYKVLIDRYRDASDTAHFTFSLYDIEVNFDLADGKGYPKPENPHGDINLIQCWDNHNNRYTVFVLDHLKNEVKLKDKDYGVEMFDVDIVWCWSEREILEKFAQYLEPIDVLGAWFGAGFDLPYIMERSIILFGETKAKTMYCRDGHKATSREFINLFGNEAVDWQLVGRKHIDLMEIYKKFIPGQRPSFSLDAICGEDLGIQKVQYEDEGDLGELYRKNPQRFCEYGLHDVRLLYMLNKKHNLMDMVRTVAIGGSVLFSDVTGSVKPIEQGFMKFCREKGNIVLPDKKHHDKEKYDGAVVYDTVSGRHDWTFSLDLRSLYPFTMIALGLSPETMLYQCSGEYEDYVAIISKDDSNGPLTVIDMQTSHTELMLPSELESIIRDEGWTISANATIYNGKLGLLSEYIASGFKLRKEYQTLMKKYDAEGNKNMAAQYDLKQKVVKVARLNAIYGATGNEHFRLYSIESAKSITLTAQVVSRHQCWKGNDVLENLVGMD